MEGSKWPPALKAWVNAVFSQCTPLTRPRVEAELKQVIFKVCRTSQLNLTRQAFDSGTMQTTDWSKVQLESCVRTLSVS